MRPSTFLSTLTLLSFTALPHLALAAPPACLINAINGQPNPADLKSICSDTDNAKAVQEAIDAGCSEEDKTTAQQEFVKTCLAEGGVSVAVYTTSPSTSTGSNTPSNTASSIAGGASSSASASGSSSSSAASQSMSDVKILGEVLLVAIGVLGFAVGL